MPKTEKIKLPASHDLAVWILGVMTAGLSLFLINILAGRSGASVGRYWTILLFCSIAAVAFFALVLGGRRQWVYYVTSVSLGILAIRGIYTQSIYIYRFISGRGPQSAPYFHVVETDEPFVVDQPMNFPTEILVVAMVGLIVWLFIWFTFGRSSRSYYRLSETGVQLAESEAGR